ncbi:hypothetical protein N2152v2_008909 [Parachlorella kessleri]
MGTTGQASRSSGTITSPLGKLPVSPGLYWRRRPWLRQLGRRCFAASAAPEPAPQQGGTQEGLYGRQAEIVAAWGAASQAAAAQHGVLLRRSSLLQPTVPPRVQRWQQLDGLINPAAPGGAPSRVLPLGWVPAKPAVQQPVPAPPVTPAVAAVPQGMCLLEGTVQKVQFRCSNTAYSVLRVQVTTSPELEAAAAAAGAGALLAPKGRHGSRGSSTSPSSGTSSASAVPYRPRKVTLPVVGSLPTVAVGQRLRFTGSWGEHRQYGWQFKASDIEELSPQNDSDLVAYLAGGAIPGVGPVMAQRLVDKWGPEVEAVLDSPSAVEMLVKCDKVGAKTAEKIKAGWDMSRGTREGVMFLREHGVPIPLAQRVADKWGASTRALVERDPYAALAGLGLGFNKVDQLAARIGAPADLVSRGALALQDILSAAAAEDGHVYLPWKLLEPKARRLLVDAGRNHGHPWVHAEALHLVAQHMHAGQSGLVAEAPPLALLLEAEAGSAAGGAAAATEPTLADALAAEISAGQGGRERTQQQQQGVQEAVGRVHPKLEGEAEYASYLRGKISGLSEQLFQSMWDTLGPSVVAVLDSPPAEACRQLKRCRRIGPKTAERFKSRWDASFGVDSSGAGSGGGKSLGLRVEDLMAKPPAVDWAWGPETRCYSPALHQAEEMVTAVALQKASAYKPPSAAQLHRVRAWLARNETEDPSVLELSEGQRAAIEVAASAPIMVLTGGPGCGKTSTVQTIVKLWGAQGKLVRICAPTGRAAQRMGAIQGIEPCTIHRLLRYQPRRGPGSDASSAAPSSHAEDAAADEAALGSEGAGAFEHGPDNPLPAGAVLVDEASMLSLPLAAALFGALTPRCQLVLVGDVDQLPPVGPGSVLDSLIQSGLVPVVDLREIFRQAAESCIITSAVAVRRGEAPALHPVRPTPQDLDAAPSDALWVEADSSEQVPAMVRQTVQALVITPMRKGQAGTISLNPLLQQFLNPPHPQRPEVPRHAGGGSAAGTAAPSVFRLRDRVIQLVNNYDKDIFNGDQGTVVEASPLERKLVVRFPKTPTADSPADHVDVTYQGQELSQLELAYAVTVHKAQGGEARHVILALSRHHGRMLTRRLLYTGLTRAKEQLIVVAPGGPDSPVAQAVQRAEYGARLSSLEERLLAGGDSRGLGQHQPRVFSNESEVLQLHQAELAEAESILQPHHQLPGHEAQRGQQQQPQQQPQQQQLLESQEQPQLQLLPHPHLGSSAGTSGSSERLAIDRSQPAPAAAAEAESGTAGKGRSRGRPRKPPAAADEAASGAATSSRKARKLRPCTQEDASRVLQSLSGAAASNAAYLLEHHKLPPKVVEDHLAPLLNNRPQQELRTTLPAVLALLQEELCGKGGGGLPAPALAPAQLAAHAPQVLLSTPEEVRQRLEFLQGLPDGGSRLAEKARNRLGNGGAGGPAVPAGSRSLVDELVTLRAICATMQQQEAARRRAA